MNKYILIFLGVALVGVAAFFLLRRRSSTPPMVSPGPAPTPMFTGSRVVSPGIPAQQVPLAVPQMAQPPAMSKSEMVKSGLTLAATVGCTAYTGGAGAPLCGIAAPLAVNLASKGASAAWSGIKKLF